MQTRLNISIGGEYDAHFYRSSVLDDDDQLFSLDEDAPIDSMYTARYRNDVDDEEEGEEEGDTDGECMFSFGCERMCYKNRI